ncbi:MAG: hypothetical protein LC648_04265, partial [Novosphingobium sp.]|nr:hypothetical protein [Novosphingobium sp.]
MNRAAPALAAALVVAALLVTSCATDKVTLLDNEAGGSGALAVLDADGGETVIDRANTEAGLRDGPTRVKAVKAIKPA